MSKCNGPETALLQHQSNCRPSYRSDETRHLNKMHHYVALKRLITALTTTMTTTAHNAYGAVIAPQNRLSRDLTTELHTIKNNHQML